MKLEIELDYNEIKLLETGLCDMDLNKKIGVIHVKEFSENLKPYMNMVNYSFRCTNVTRTTPAFGSVYSGDIKPIQKGSKLKTARFYLT